MENLTISKEAVLEASSKCPQAKQTLQILFPQVFEEEKTYSRGNIFALDFSGNMKYYILAGIAECLQLYSLSDGRLWSSEVISVENAQRVSHKELQNYVGKSKTFSLFAKDTKEYIKKFNDFNSIT